LFAGGLAVLLKDNFAYVGAFVGKSFKHVDFLLIYIIVILLKEVIKQLLKVSNVGIW